MARHKPLAGTDDAGAEIEIRGIRQWVSEFVSPQTLLWIAVIMAGIGGAWVTFQSRMAVLESSVQLQITLLQKEIDSLDREHREDTKTLSDKIESDVRKSDRTQDEADRRLWEDIAEIRRELFAIMGHK